MLQPCITYFLHHKGITFGLFLLLVSLGWMVSPFGEGALGLKPIPVDALPDLGDNQHIVYTEWKGQSPEDIENQITYPLTSHLLGLSGVKTLRASSMFGFSMLHVTFNEKMDFHFARSRLFERLSTLPAGYLPAGVFPKLGPEATALGQVFWYTIESQNAKGKATSAWDLHEKRYIQDFYIKYALSAVSGVAEVASIGGFVQEYQMDIDPHKLANYGLNLRHVVNAVQRAGRDIGARTLEINQVEYFVRGLGAVTNQQQLEEIAIGYDGHTALRLKDVAHIGLGPAPRRGVLDKAGKETVGGVVVAAYGENPKEVITRIKHKIKNLNASLPQRIDANGHKSQLQIVPFYDRSQLIQETLGVLQHTLWSELIITLLVIGALTLHFRSALLVAIGLPVALLVSFVAMKALGLQAHLLSIAGMAIAIGSVVDFGIVLVTNLRHKIANTAAPTLSTYYQAIKEITPSLITTAASTIISFLPILLLEGAEGKLFKPLALTKTLTLTAALIATLLLLPALAHMTLSLKRSGKYIQPLLFLFFVWASISVLKWIDPWSGACLLFSALGHAWMHYAPSRYPPILKPLTQATLIIALAFAIAAYWKPLGGQNTIWQERAFVMGVVGSIIGFFYLIKHYYSHLLTWCLHNKKLLLSIPIALLGFAVVAWLGVDALFGGLARTGKPTEAPPTDRWAGLSNLFPGLSSTFMPALDEGSFLYMPTALPNIGIEESTRILRTLDKAAAHIPEVQLVVGKLGRAETVLDPAPLSMYENLIQYHPEYAIDSSGRLLRFQVDEKGHFVLRNGGALPQQKALAMGIGVDSLVQTSNGLPFRQWRTHIRSSDDIWDEIVSASRLPSITPAPKLHPIETRVLMLQTGQRAAVYVQLLGNDLDSLSVAGDVLAKLLKKVPHIDPKTVFAEPLLSKPYVQLKIKREALQNYGLSVEEVQQSIEAAIGGMELNTFYTGRHRTPVRIRYLRALRDHPEAIQQIQIHTPSGKPIRLQEVVAIEYAKGASAIRSEGLFLTHYISFEPKRGYSYEEAVIQAKGYVEAARAEGHLGMPQQVQYQFGGAYQDLLRANRRLKLIIPLVALSIMLILYLRFRSVSISTMVFTGVFVAFGGGFIALWGYDIASRSSLFGFSLAELWPLKSIPLSMSVWVGFIALLGLVTDDGVLMASHIQSHLKEKKPQKALVLQKIILCASQQRIQAAIMTTATTLIALLPILTSNGRGADLMIPIAIPIWGGMWATIINYFLIPTLYYLKAKRTLKRSTL